MVLWKLSEKKCFKKYLIVMNFIESLCKMQLREVLLREVRRRLLVFTVSDGCVDTIGLDLSIENRKYRKRFQYLGYKEEG